MVWPETPASSPNSQDLDVAKGMIFGITPGFLTIDTTVNVEIFDIDLFDVPQSTIDTLHARGSKVICYISAGTWENWRPDGCRRFP